MSEEQNTPVNGEQTPAAGPSNMQDPDKQSVDGAKILGLNLLVFAAYAIAGYVSGDKGFTALVVGAIHFVICTIVAIFSRKWAWLLAGIIVLLIGMATCFGTVS